MRKILTVAFYAWLSCGALAQQATISAPRGALIPNYTANGGLPKWQACRAKVIANTANCKVLMIGDSTFAGYGASYNAGGVDARALSTPSQLAAILKQPPYNINASTASIVGAANAGNAASYAAYDTRTVFNNWHTNTDSNPTIGNSSFANTDNTGSFNFSPPDSGVSFPSNVLQTDTLDLIAIGYSGSGGHQISVNGGATISTVATTGANQYIAATISTTLGPNTWNDICNNVSSSHCIFVVMRAYNSAQSEISIMNAGWSGSTVVDWTNTGETPWDPLSSIGQIAPDLCIINLTINDWNAGTNTTTYSNDLQSIITECKLSGDVLLVTGNPTQPATTSYSTQQTYVNVNHTLATSNNIPILDMWATLCGVLSGLTCPNGGWLAGMGAGWNAALQTTADALHQGIGGTSRFADFIAQVLMQ